MLTLSGIQSGQRDQIDELYALMRDQANRLTHDRHLQQDLTQIGVMAVIKDLHTYTRSKATLVAFVMTCGISDMKDEMKASGRRANPTASNHIRAVVTPGVMAQMCGDKLK